MPYDFACQAKNKYRKIDYELWGENGRTLTCSKSDKEAGHH